MTLRVRRERSWRLFLFVLVFAVLIAPGSAKPAFAATTIAVDCTTDPSALATALASANDGDTLAIQGICKGTFDIAHSLTLTGSAGATLDGQGAGTVMTVDAGKTVSVNTLTITGGNGSSAGGILNNGTLTLTNSTVSGNSATPGTSLNLGGGGIFNQAGSVTVTNSRVVGNSASVASGRNGVGGILNLGGSLTLTDSTVSGNSATSGVSSSTAVGGILNLLGSVTLTSSTVSGNSGSALSDAFGGILNSAPGSVVTLINSTVSANNASATGGPSAFSSAVAGISNSGGTLSLTSVTLADNSVSEPSGGFLPPVGGVSDFFGGTLTIANSLIARQSGGPNCYGPNSDGGYNLDNGTSCGFSTANNSLSSTDPLLDPAGLKDNGGPTQTIALLPGSPAIDVIPSGANGCGTTLTSDQRGVSRPQGAGCDIGAFEFVTAPSAHRSADVSIVKTGPASVRRGFHITYTLTVKNNGPAPAENVAITDTLPAGLFSATATPSKGTCTVAGSAVTCDLGSLSSGEVVTVRIVASTRGVGAHTASLSNTATVSSTTRDPDSSNNSSTVTTALTS